MHTGQKARNQFPVGFSLRQRQAIARLFPDLADRLRLDEANQKRVAFTLEELSAIRNRSRTAVRTAGTGFERATLRCVEDLAKQAIARFEGIGAIPGRERIYQFRITLEGIKPAIWRRIQTRNCDLDKLHERIQTAMGWTNSHLHHFRVGDQLYGDPWLMEENFHEFEYKNSRLTLFAAILPESGKRFRFEYEYDFGDCWTHEVLFEGCLREQRGLRYPICVEGERACPPEDVGGTPGYREFLEAIADPEAEDHDRLLTWIGGSFDPEEFDAEKATKKMRRGLPDWRKSLYSY
jgi:Plasmid pRiA4b ORF-3-like protein